MISAAFWLTGGAHAKNPAGQPSPKARLLFAEEIAASFKAQPRVPVIVNLVPPPRAREAMDWNSAASLRSLREANRAAQDAVLRALDAHEHTVRYRFDNLAGFSCELTEPALQKLLHHPQVESIEPVRELQPHLAQGIPLMNALASRSTYTGANLAIAICDTGIDYTHPRLGGGGFPNSKVIGGYDFGNNDANPMPVGQAHGTACAGIAAGDLGTVGDYIGGVAPGARLYALKISADGSGSATSDAMIAAWDWCVTHKNDDPNNPILVISTSFGGGRYFSACDSASPGMTAAANNAVAAGITLLVSSGNNGYCDSISWPACISSVISVGAVYDANFGTYLPCVDGASCAPKTSTTGCATGWYATDSTQPDKVTSYSNTAPFLGVLAPANQCYTLDIVGSGGYSSGDYYASFGGTSAACPYAAGAVACLQHAAKTLTGSYLTPAQVRERLTATGNLLADPKVAITKPRVNLANAIAALSSPLISLHSATLTGEGCLPANGAIDPGETVTVEFALQNTGGGNTTNLVVTLLATGGVTSPSSPQSYGVLSTNGAPVARSFTFTAAGICGGTIEAVLQLQDGAMSYGTITNVFSLGGVSGPVITNNYSSGNINVPITDFSTVEIPIAVTHTGVVNDVNVRIRLNHTWDGDLTISLVHPDGTVIALAAERGGSGDNYGSGATDCSGTPTIFDDSAGTPIGSGSAPFAGAYRPDEMLAALNGKPTHGVWKLRVTDSYAQDTGAIFCFQLDIARQNYDCCKGPPVPVIQNAFTTLTAESCPTANGVIDPGETVTVEIALQNIGGADTTNLVATLLATGGVTSPSGPQSYGVLSTNGAPVARLFTFTASGVCGGTIQAVLQLQDGETDHGTRTNAFTLGTSAPQSFTNANNAAVAIPASGQSGPASPYPSTIAVNGLTGTITKVTVTLQNLSHTRADNLDVLLVGPAGQMTLLMSDAGGNNALSGVTLTFDMDGSPLPTTAITSGTYAPTDYTSGDTFNAPAPAGPYGTDLTVFNGVNPNGTWSLFIMDDAAPNSGSLAGGWRLNLTLAVPACCEGAGELPPSITGQPDAQHICAGSTAQFTVTATGDNLAYQWQKDSTNLTEAGHYSGVATATLTVSPADGADVAGYRCVVSNTGGSVTSAVAALTLKAPTMIAGQSAGQDVCAGGTAQFSVNATGAGTLAFQWQKNNADLTEGGHVSGVTSNVLTISDADGDDAGNYRCVVTADCGSASSTNVALTVSFPQLHVSPASYDFGIVATGTTAQTSVTVSNAGCGTLIVAISVDGPFEVLPELLEVVAGMHSNVTVSFTPTGETAYTNAVVFSSNGGAVTNLLTGSGALPVSAGFTADPTSGAAPLVVTFTDISTGTITGRAWAFGDGGTTNTTATTVEYIYAAAGTNSVQLIVTGPLGASTNTMAALIIVTVLDTDGDGLPDEWEIAHGLDPNDPDDADWDNDGDGFTNYQEYLAGTDPNDASDALRIVGIRIDDDNIVVSFTTKPDKLYRLEWSSNPDGSAPTTAADNLAGTGGVVEATDVGGAGQPLRFYRVRLLP